MDCDDTVYLSVPYPPSAHYSRPLRKSMKKRMKGAEFAYEHKGPEMLQGSEISPHRGPPRDHAGVTDIWTQNECEWGGRGW